MEKAESRRYPPVRICSEEASRNECREMRLPEDAKNFKGNMTKKGLRG
jgi:hypothetical protein